jgi:hypothetical protein
VIVVKKVAVTAPGFEEGLSDSATLRDFNNYSLWSITMSLVVIAITFVFMVFA